jgi:hypothetical protein
VIHEQNMVVIHQPEVLPPPFFHPIQQAPKRVRGHARVCS